MGVLFTLIAAAGYLLPIPSLIWGWVRWLSSKPRLAPPVWRHVAVFSGLALASTIGLSVLFLAFHVNGLPEGPTKYNFALVSGRFGFTASILALVLSLTGKGPVRLPASMASLGLAAFWVTEVITY